MGASIWDLHEIMQDLDPKSAGINYDVGHATIEGGLGGWINSFRISGAHLRGIAVKDFAWAKDAKGEWQAQWKPIGEGMVHFPEFFGMVAETPFRRPACRSTTNIRWAARKTAPGPSPCRGTKSSRAMKKDLDAIRGYMGKAGL